MGTLSIEISDTTNSAIELISARNHVSVQQFIVSAINEKMSVLERQGYLEERAQRGKAFDIQAFLKKVPDVPTEKVDR